ncbi:hypothetical protein P389DRAFT_65742 [Cystobasidium minutum MCA 4210]|uniref:uncharacterized protein n=1 Tax=Cystobasidium minutum MCA 4210 TaxID=1397322 RepID=UPI0034CF8B5E|eukprot:jgi/Rhomi1/65742/CE65741_458
MPRENAARGWAPGEAIVFSPNSSSSSSSEASTLKMAAAGTSKARQPLAAMKNAKQSRKLSEEDVTKPKEYQTTLSPWTKAAWKPGMRVLIASSSKQATMIEKDGNSVHYSKKGKEKATEPQVEIKKSGHTARKTARLYQDEHVPFQSYNIYEDPSPGLSPQRKSSKNLYYDTTEDSLSSIKAVLNEDSQLDPDSSIEFLGQRTDPRADALRHLALAKANFLEASKATSKATSSTLIEDASSHGSVLAPTVAYRRRRINFVKSPSPSPRRSFGSTSYASDKSSSWPATIDWDDPVLNPAASDDSTSLKSDSSNLPEIPYQKARSTVPPSKPSTSTSTKSSSVTAAPSDTLSSAYTVSKRPSARPRVEPSKVKELKPAGRRYVKEDREARERRKETEQAELKKKYMTFSYDTTPGTTPKVWYFRGLGSGKVKFMGCDTRQGYVTDQPRNLEDLIRELKGPLGWDLEWEMWAWDENYKSKEQGKVALIQLGDKNNIILFQIERGSSIPECLLEVIEDPSIIKLGVQIKGDAQKVGRDFTWPNGQPILPKGLLDLSHFARRVHPQEVAKHGSHIISLQRLVAMYLNAYLEKGDVRTSKWESQHLNTMQRKYAANDIFASVQVYQRVLGLAETDGIDVDFETLLVDFSARLDSTTGKLRDIVSKIRKAKPVAAKKKTATTAAMADPAPRTVATSLSPRIYEAWETWSLQELERDEVAQRMNVKESTVASYIIKALITDPELEYDVERLRALLKGMVIPNFQKPQVEQLLMEQPAVVDK